MDIALLAEARPDEQELSTMFTPVALTSRRMLSSLSMTSAGRAASIGSWASSIRTASSVSQTPSIRTGSSMSRVSSTMTGAVPSPALPILFEDANEVSRKRRRPSFKQPDSDPDPFIGQVTLDGKFFCLAPSCSDKAFGRQADLRRYYDHTHAFEQGEPHGSRAQLLRASHLQASEATIGYVTLSGKFRCINAKCHDISFGRQADFLRHYEHTHLAKKVEYYCSVDGCPRSRKPAGRSKGRSFGTREDKMREHYRTVHETLKRRREEADVGNEGAYGVEGRNRSFDLTVEGLLDLTGEEVQSAGHWLYRDSFTFPYTQMTDS